LAEFKVQSSKFKVQSSSSRRQHAARSSFKFLRLLAEFQVQSSKFKVLRRGDSTRRRSSFKFLPFISAVCRLPFAFGCFTCSV
jgi:hypothetical protein